MQAERYYFDIETDSIPASKVWFCVVKPKGSEEYQVFRDAESLNKWVAEHPGVTLVGHNALRFDAVQLEKWWGTDFSNVTLDDTLVKSRRSYKGRPNGHKLEVWGQTLGFPKGDFKDYDGPVNGESWAQWYKRNIAYCKQDVAITEKVDEAVDLELEGTSEESRKLEEGVAAIINQQVRNGWLLDERACVMLLAELKEKKLELEEEVRRVFVPLPVAGKTVVPKIKGDGGLSKVGLKFMGDRWDTIGGVLTRIDYPLFDLGSRQQIARHLQYYGWEPTVFTEPTESHPNGQVSCSEDVLLNIDCDIPQAKLIVDYMTCQKRIAMAESWLELRDDDGRVHGEVNSNGAVTGRMTHSNPNMAQVVAKDKEYGPEMRRCWIAREGYRIVGMDADGLELRMLAHYMNSATYIKAVAEGDKDLGTDAHTVNMRAAGLDSRDNAKTFIYAFLYGAGDAKIGKIVGGTKVHGRKLKRKFLASTPALRDLRERVEKAARRGWLKGLDGRRIEVRAVYAALNTLLQGAGAVVMKQALVYLVDMAARQGLDFYIVNNVHDEIQTEVREDHCERFAELAEDAMRMAGEHFNLRIPLVGNAAIGDNWYDTH